MDALTEAVVLRSQENSSLGAVFLYFAFALSYGLIACKKVKINYIYEGVVQMEKQKNGIPALLKVSLSKQSKDMPS